jgi:hypothetical protein
VPRSRILSFESRGEPLLTRAQFAGRLAVSLATAALLIAASLAAGMVGYRASEGMPWLDAFLNASMILGGMGPVDAMKTDAGKFFAGCYALYSGLALVLTTGLILAPIPHRVMHRFHLEDDADLD